MKNLLKKAGKGLFWLTWFVFLFTGISAIVHSVLTPKEKEISRRKLGDKLKFADVNGNRMSAYVTGSGKKTIVMLSGLGTGSPIADFMPLAERLGADHKVVILEYFGYGHSDITSADRSNAAFVEEIRSALKKLDIAPPYILMPHSISGFYSLYYALKFPDEVAAILGIDESKPDQAKTNKFAKMKMGAWISYLNSAGIFRTLIYLIPSLAGIRKEFKENATYSEEQWKFIEMASAWNAFNVSIVTEQNWIYRNATELFGVKYPAALPTLSFLAKGTVEQSKIMVEKKTLYKDWLILHEEIISNPAIQKVEILEGAHYLHHTQTNKIAELTNEFISSHIK
jgi:pimeloyl-ACP methyl ester carboxylesterase